MAAFTQAVDGYQADILELDVRATRDGVIVVHHDETLDRTTSGTGRVQDLTWAEVSAVDAGHHFLDLEGRPSFRGRGVRVPRIEEVLEAFPHTRLNIETKSSDSAAGLVEAIRAAGAEERVLVAAQVERHRRDARGYRGPWGASERQVRRFWVLRALGRWYTPRADVLQIPDRWEGRQVATPRLVAQAHARNLPVHVWVVDDAERIRELLEWGVDSVQSDRLDVLAEVLHRCAGRPLPPALVGGA